MSAHIMATRTGPLQRLIGTVDVHGKGTLHPLHDVDPVVLMDQAHLTGAGLPKFGMHPHFGLIACSVVVDGAVSDGDNLGASPAGNTRSGGIYCASSGKGVCHEEFTAAEENHILQVIVRTPRDKLGLGPQITKAAAEELPSLGDGSVTLLCGELDGHRSPATPDAWPDAVFLRVRLAAGQSLDQALPDDSPHGFAVPLGGSGTVARQPVDAGKPSVLVFGKPPVPGAPLAISSGEPGLDLFVAAGKPMLDEPWVKKLGNNGFGIFRNEQEATEVMDKVLAAGNDFSFKTLEEEEEEEAK